MIIYIANFNLPNTSAYSHHVIKMCDALKSNTNSLQLLIPYKNKSYKFNNIKNDYILKNDFKINTFLNIKLKGFFSRIIFFISVLIFINKNKNKVELIITRVPSISLFLSIIGIKNILELHQEFFGISKFLFKIYFSISLSHNIKFIYIHKKLKSFFSFLKSKSHIILDDATDIKDFKFKFNYKEKKDCVYTGSLSKGKGFELICQIAKKLPKIKFQIYGDQRLIDKKFLNKKLPINLIFNGHLKYKYIPKVLCKAKILLLPYSQKVYGRSKNINLGNYMSPLKLFDYLASGSAIIASNLPVYEHILKNEHNSILVPPNNISKWVMNINKLYYSNRKINKITKTNKKISNKFTWENRAKKILNFKNAE